MFGELEEGIVGDLATVRDAQFPKLSTSGDQKFYRLVGNLTTVVQVNF